MAKNASVEVRGMSRFEAVQDLFVSGTLTTSGSISLGSSVFDVDSFLELSSSAGSVVSFSASADFPNSDKNYHIRANNSHLILSSSAGSIVALSSNLQFPVDAPEQSAHILAKNSHLILSSSTGTVYVSGAISVKSGGTLLGGLAINRSANGAANITIATTANCFFINQNADGMFDCQAGATFRWSATTNCSQAKDTQFRRVTAGIIGMSGSAGHSGITSDSGHLILSSTLGSVVILSSSQDFPNADKPYHVRAVNSHLVLSSSAGSIVSMSGALKMHRQTLASFPTGDDNLSGSLMWDTTSKQLYVYTAAGWLQLASGSNTL